MKFAIATSNGRVSPVFDVARQLLVLDVVDGNVTGQSEAQLEEHADRKVEQLAESGIEVLICGALSQSLSEMLVLRGVQVIPFIAGATDDVLKAFVAGNLDRAQFAMPGCCGQGPGRRAGFGGRCRGRGWHGGRPTGENGTQ